MHMTTPTTPSLATRISSISLQRQHQRHRRPTSPTTPFRVAAQKEDQQEKLDKIKLNLFETLGTPENPTKWEPFQPQAQEDEEEQDNNGPALLTSLLTSIDFSEPMSFDGEEKTEYDPLRDGPLRYLGYANELGEAFAAWLFPGGVTLSYAIAIGYVLFDTVDKYQKTLKVAEEKLSTRPLPPSVNVGKLIATIGAERGIDTLVWQLIASVGAPGYTIHTVVGLVTVALQAIEQQGGGREAMHAVALSLGMSPDVLVETVNKSVPTLAGLAAIPFIVHPIDAGVHAALNVTLRPTLRRYICEEAGGCEAGLAVCSTMTSSGSGSEDAK